tara:strand:+ start:33 stop:407 length:375 start_codon:yes stop_codon:yes gene_type:complete
MATQPINKYTTQESNNLKVYENYTGGYITLTDDDADSGVNVEEGVDWIGQGHGPAKKVVILPVTGDAADEIKLYLKVGGSYGDAITVDYADFPLTIDKLLIDRIKISSDDATGNTETFSIIAYH